MRFLHRTMSGPDNGVSASTPTTDPDGLVLRAAAHADLPVMSRAHVQLLPVGLFPSLGTRFVRRWHRTYLDSPHGFGYVVVDPAAPEEIVGFLVGTTDHAAHTAALVADRRMLASLAITGFSALCVRPRVAARLLRSRLRPWARRLASQRQRATSRRPAAPTRTGSVPSPQVAVMSALAVHPDWRGSGIGVRLAMRFVEHVRDAGATRAELQTSTGPLGAAGFYERLGWEAGPQQSSPDGDDALRTYHLALRAVSGGT
ncbi:GNAT family N-acetyltransferase [Micromonospora halophytica]|uniref:Acetyltransferase (GNAT) family protein n=1 Tax=Micromonospora halophytica TaxID=47864 RepID=A0A1C5H6E3_9ACTN|nr:GNAT family N-acetyltransferase [Micromonospora halophytica]SCG41001.1 Acetyltransferase (GNAT) family protein [Micromonospora halophytica]